LLGTPTAPLTVGGGGLAINTWTGAVTTVAPANGAFVDATQTNNGFFVVGPDPNNAAYPTVNMVNANPQLPMTFATQQMTIPLTLAQAPDQYQTGTTIVLQRLACPYIPPNDPRSATFNANLPLNPYVTIDYVQNINTTDDRFVNSTGAVTPKAMWQNYTVGRRQPYFASMPVTQRPYTTVAAASNKQALPGTGGVINVASTVGFPTPPMGGSYNINVNIGGTNQLVTYTGLTATSFTGCTTTGAGTLLTNQVVTPASQPQHTFFRHNSAVNNNPQPTDKIIGATTLDVPFTWLAHLDRPVVNALELLHVSAWPQHELTQRFIMGGWQTKQSGFPASQMFQHYAPWLDHSAMIYRALDLLGVPSYLTGGVMGGRVPAKININTITEPEIFQALCDAYAGAALGGPPSNYYFNNADVLALYSALVASRTPNGVPGPPTTDRPFRSLAAGWIASGGGDVQYPTGSGLGDTLLRVSPTATFAGKQRLLQVPAGNGALGAVAQPMWGQPKYVSSVPNNSPSIAHPYQQTALLQKIFNNVTTTSNVFAIWLTVGFFEVQDVDAAGNAIVPPKIGSEIGRDQNVQVRHRMFAIVDRSQVQLFNSTGTMSVAKAGTTVTVSAPTLPNPLLNLPLVFPPNPALTPNIAPTLPNGAVWSVQPGMMLEIGTPGTAMYEVVAVTGATANASGTAYTVTANFTLPWANLQAVPVVCRGNPGPWQTNPGLGVQYLYNHRWDPAVLHYSVIQ
jgi:hypothetical protein